jgi:glycosyl transferase family 1/glycosyl transferase family 2
MTMQTLADFRNRHSGNRDVIVCGCGESLNLLAQPEPFVTIGVNDVGRKFDPTYLVVVNPRHQFSGDRFQYVASSRAQHLFTQLELGIEHPGIVRFQLGRYGGTGFTDPNVLHYTRNSPYVAICLAVHMGARRIGVLGVDFTDHHFFSRSGTHPLARRLAQIDGEYARLAAACRNNGIEIMNLSPTSRLTSLPFMTLDDFRREGPADRAFVPMPTARPKRRVFFVNYRFASCGDVFATGLAHAAETLGIDHASAWWDDAALPAKVRAFGPDLVLVVHGRKAAARWRRELREWKSAVWLLDEPYEVDDTARWSSTFDGVFVADAATRDRHQRSAYLPTCYDPSLHRLAGTERPYAVGFVGGASPFRERMLAALATGGHLSYVVGGPWRTRVLNARCRAASVSPVEASRLYQRTQIVVNVFRDQHHFNRLRTPATSLNPRIYEAVACGALVVSEWRPEIDAVVPELPTFRSEQELVALVERLLADPDERERIRTTCAARLAPHTYAQRLRTVMETMIDAAGRTTTPPVSDAVVPHGWTLCGPVELRVKEDALALEHQVPPAPGSERGLVTHEPHERIALSFDAWIPSEACFVAKVHQTSRDDQSTNSYHLYCDSSGSYVARHHHVLGRVIVPRDRWTRLALTCADGLVALSCDGATVLRAYDRMLRSGYAVLSVKRGAVSVRGIEVATPEVPVDGPDPIASHHLYGDVRPTPPRVSIVTTVYDRVECLERCLRSVNALAYKNIEQIVVSDAPPPQVTAAIASAVRAHDRGHLRYFNLAQRHENWGIAPAEVGLRRSTGELVCFLSDDNGYTPEHVGTLLNALDRDPGLGFVYSSCRYAGRLVLSHPVPAPARIDLGQPMFRRELFARFFDNRLPFDMMAWDWALINSLVQQGVRWQHVNVPSFIFRLAAYPHLIASGT